MTFPTGSRARETAGPNDEHGEGTGPMQVAGITSINSNPETRVASGSAAAGANQTLKA